jgi:multisubunit Na+/H+ antiporter MnhE subunit
MLQIFTMALPVGLLWVGVTGRVTVGSLLVGYVVGMVVLVSLRRLGVRLRATFTPRQAVAFLRYCAWLFWNTLVSSVQVARLILRPRMDLRTGIIALATGDTSTDQRLAALSAHGLNMSPGQLVIDFDNEGTLYVHCLDLEAARLTLEPDQARRLRMLQAVLGEDRHE